MFAGPARLTQATWDSYIDRAKEVAIEAEEIWLGAAPQQIEPNDFLRRATYNLRVTLLVQYHAVLKLLRDPIVSFAGETLLRGELEALAHLAWIMDGEAKSNRRIKRLRSKLNSNHCFSHKGRKWSTPNTRALCWLTGEANWFHRNAALAPPSLKDPRATRQARDRVRRLQRLHRESGCPGKRWRDQADVEPMLVLLAKRFKLIWLPELWRAYSGTAHQGIALRLVTQLPSGGVMWGGELSENERRVLLVRNVTVFLNAYQHVLYLSSGGVGLSDYISRVGKPGSKLCAELNGLAL